MKLPEQDNSEEKSKALTRQQRRVKDRIEAEATAQLNRLQNRFMEFVINCENPETECEEKKKVMNAQWKMYCNSKRFSEKARSIFEDWAAKIIDQYKIESSEKEEGFGITEPVKTND